jgi:two-component system OmpR family response regulator
MRLGDNRDMPRILLVDDDDELRDMLGEYLARDGFEIETAADGAKGAEMALAPGVDLVVLDVMMPGTDGIEALRRIRAASQIPVLMLTARGDDVDRIVGLELGADDYVPKPCTPRELAARIRAILRRSDRTGRDVISVGSLTLHTSQRRATLGDAPVDLTGAEFEVLTVLARHAGTVVSKRVLSREALGREPGRFDRSIDMHVSGIRQKLGTRSDGSSWIQTVRGRGYQLVAD